MKRILAMALALVLVACAAVAGTVAWLTDSTSEVENTFTVGNIDIDLTETTEDYKILPGTTQAKDPTVTVKANSEPCFVFVTVKEERNVAPSGTKYVTYTVDEGWTQLMDGENPVIYNGAYVYYRAQAATTADVPYDVLKGDSVAYLSSLTKNDIDQLYTTDADGKMIPDSTKTPKLTFQAFAIQQTNGDGTIFATLAAWNAVKPAP